MARNFNGSSQYLQVESAVLTATPITLACWSNSNTIAANQSSVWVGDSGSADNYFSLSYDGAAGGDPLRAVTAGGGFAVAGINGYQADVWEHGCAVFASATSRSIYLNGPDNQATNTSSKTPSSIDRMAIGRNADSSPAGYFDGEIAEVGIWNIALTDAEVAVLAAGYSPLFVHPQNLVLYMPLIRGFEDRVGGVVFTNTSTVVATHPGVYYPKAPISNSTGAPAPYVPSLLFGDHASDIPPRVDTAAGVPSHSATEGTLYWDTTADKLYVNNNGGTAWTALN